MRMPSWLSFFIKQLFAAKSALVYISLLTVGSALLHALAPSLIGRILGKAADRTAEGILPLMFLALSAWAGAEVLAVLRSYLSFRAMQKVTYQLTDQLLTSIFHTKMEHLLQTRRGELMQRCLDDTKAVQQFSLFTLPSLAQSLLLAGIAGVVVGRMNAGIVIVLGVSYLILFVPIHRVGAKRKEARLQLVRHNAELRHSLTILDNIRYGRDEPSTEELALALQASGLDAWVAKLPGGLHTRVGDRGLILSGGERQRISIARAILRKPAILILDEATSALDYRTERHLLERILQVLIGSTLVFITHRPAIAERSDQLYMVRDGELLVQDRAVSV